MHKFNTYRKLNEDFLNSLPEEDRKYFIEYVRHILHFYSDEINLMFKRLKKMRKNKKLNNKRKSCFKLI